MTRCVVGSGIQAYSAELDFYGSLAYWKPLNPVSMVVVINSMNDKNRIFEAQDAWKQTLVLARYIVTVDDKELDGALHTKPQGQGDNNYYLVSPENYMNLIEPMAEKGAVLYWGNEPSGEVDAITFDRLVKHTVEGIALGNERKKSLCVLHWGVGHPLLANNDTELDPRLDPVLMALANSTTPQYWGLHLYEPADTIKRLEALEGSCKRLEIEMPLTIISEWGYDAAFAGDPLNGYKTRTDGLGLAQMTIGAVKGKLKRFFESGRLVAVIGFSEGGEPKQHNFNYANDAGYKDEIKRAAQAGELDVNTTDLVYKKDIVFGQPYRLRKSGDVIKAYILPYTGDPISTFKTIPDNAIVTVLDKVSMNGATWLKVSYKNFTAPVYIQSDLIDIRQTVETAVVKVDPAPAPTTIPETIPAAPVTPAVVANKGYVPTQAQITRLEKWRDLLTSTIAEKNEELAIVNAILDSVKETA